MIIESGVIVALGLIFMFFKLSWKRRLQMLGYPMLMDVVVFLVLNWIHAGTFSGVMTAAVGALVCSALISLGRNSVGYIERGRYVPGRVDVLHKIK